MKSNKYVYPFIPFKNLNNKKLNSKFLSRKTISIIQLKVEAEAVIPPKIVTSGKDIDHKILNIFLNSKIIFGPRKYITDNKEYWIKKINYFTKQGQPILFSLLGFPFKMPVPIKTNRTLPDMGEVLSLKRIHNITLLIEKIYKPSAKVILYGEGVFGRFNELTQKEYKGYINFLKFLLKGLNLNNNIEIRELEEMEALSSDFENQFRSKITQFTRLYEAKDEAFMKKYNGAKPSLLKVVNTKRITSNLDILMDVYNDSKLKISPEVSKIREIIKEKTHIMLIKYLAYISVRDDLNFLEKSAPHSLALSVSPKPLRL